jgi:translocation and assembly module TamB
MSEHEPNLGSEREFEPGSGSETGPDRGLPVSHEPAQPRKWSRLRRFFLRHVPLSLAALAILLAVVIANVFFWASSSRGEALMRGRLVAWLEQSTGGRVEIATFHWHLLSLEADAGGLVIHGLEAPGEAPYAQAENLRVRLSVLGFLSPRILLREADVTRPAFHLIVNVDGTTNQPHPAKPQKMKKSALDTFFDLKAGRVSVEQGVLHYENRAANFDLQNRWIPLDFEADDVSLLMSYMPAAVNAPEFYHIEAGAADLNMSRGKAKPMNGTMRAVMDLSRDAVYLRSLRVTSRALSKASRIFHRATEDHTVEFSGTLQDFTHPHWQAKATGELDMKIMDPVFGFPFTPEGIAHLDLNAAGQGGYFHTDGTVHIDSGSYIAPGIDVTGVRADTHVYFDQDQLIVNVIDARLRQGGQVDGELQLTPWLAPVAGSATLKKPSGVRTAQSAAAPKLDPTVHPPPPFIPFNGKVKARFKDVALDTVLDIFVQPPFQRLGLDTRLNGTGASSWSNGDMSTLVVSATGSLSPSAKGVKNEAPATGSLDATYTQRDGSVDLRKLEVNTPASQLLAQGHLGAFPINSPTALTVEFHSHNLDEFDTILRDLGLNLNGKSGTEALPASLTGQIDFLHGTWNGSLVDPHLAGNAKATQLSIEMPVIVSGKPSPPGKNQTLQPVYFDSVEATGSYSAQRIAIDRGVLRRGKSEINLSGTLDAAASRGHAPAFDANSVLHARLQANKVGLDDVQALAGQSVTAAGTVDAQLQADGPIHALGGSGWIELDGSKFYGESVTRLRAQGTMANSVIKLASINASAPAGSVSATGSYDLNAHSFQIDAKGEGIDVAKFETVQQQGIDIIGKLGFTAHLSGTSDDPRLDAHATLSPLTLAGEPLGGLDFVAHTFDRSLTYNATTRLEGAELNVHGQTALTGDNATQAEIVFSRFNIGGLLRAAHIQGLTGESALAGTITVEGPLAHPDQLRGEARLDSLAVTVAGVHLESQGGVHATLADSRLKLDPLHVTGEQTDLHMQGSLALKGQQQLDISAKGSINLKLAETVDPDLTSSGTTTFQVEAHGPLKNPDLQGRIDFENGSLSLEDIPNGLSQLKGTLEFNQNRLEVRSLTAMSGGGLLSVTGTLAYQHGIYADLSVTGKGIRIRYPPGVSSLADATLHLQGSQSNLLLGGDVMITRFSVSPDLDIAAVAAQANAIQPIAPPDAPSNHIRLDVHVASSPQLNFQNAYAKLAGDVDLRLRGTVASPSLLGRVSITEGSATIAGTRYDLQRGDIFFTNPVRIEPSIDLNATARVEDYDITLGLHGTVANPTLSLRSDPPMPEADVVALLALGRSTGDQQRINTQQQEQSLANPTTDALLGGALNATVSSRVQKLFGAGSVKVDPNYLGALGNSTSRIIVEEQVGRNLTLTYATNVNTTSQQLIQAEVAVNRQYSVVVARDESGVFSMVFKATRRFR